MKQCNICDSLVFTDFSNRIGVQCATCQSLERHRLVRWVLGQLGYMEITSRKRALHLAPEAATHRYMAEFFDVGYFCADPKPENYPHAECLKLALPEGLDIFPDGYFNLILHNHVLEHIPGDYHDHLFAFSRLLASGGHMVFTVPIAAAEATIQGGELLNSDEERKSMFGQADHYKIFGRDLLDWSLDGYGTFESINIPREVRDNLKASSDQVFVYSKF